MLIMIKLHIKESEYNKLQDNPRTDIANKIAAWVYSSANTVVDKMCDIEDFIDITFPPKCTHGKNFFSQVLQDTLSLEELEQIEDKFINS